MSTPTSVFPYLLPQNATLNRAFESYISFCVLWSFGNRTVTTFEGAVLIKVSLLPAGYTNCSPATPFPLHTPPTSYINCLTAPWGPPCSPPALHPHPSTLPPDCKNLSLSKSDL